MEKHSEVKVIEEKFSNNFEEKANDLIKSGWQIISSNCTTETFDDNSVGKIYQAILIKLEKERKQTPPPASGYMVR
jgi:hypothetical protein